MQALLWPLRSLYAVLGPALMRRLDGALDLDCLVRNAKGLDILAASILLAVPCGSLALLQGIRPPAKL